MPDILDLIDGALGDYAAGGDAMRWTPDPPRVICDGGDVLWPERYSILRHGAYRMSVTAADFTGMGTELSRFAEYAASEVLPVMTRAFEGLHVFCTCSAHAPGGLLAAPGYGPGGHRRAEVSRMHRMHRTYRRRSLARHRRKR